MERLLRVSIYTYRQKFGLEKLKELIENEKSNHISEATKTPCHAEASVNIPKFKGKWSDLIDSDTD